jgi:hexosaminidase
MHTAQAWTEERATDSLSELEEILSMDENLMLLPMPRLVSMSGGVFTVPDRRFIVLDNAVPQALRFAARRLQEALREHADVAWEVVASNTVPQDQVGITLSVMSGDVRHPQGYELTITEAGVHAVAGTPAGAFYAAMTLCQILDQRSAELPTLRISDWPDFPNRGVMLDISRDKVPSLETLFDLMDLLASWKINQLQLYTEHTFAYRNHPEVWAEASPMTAEDILALDAFCRERFIELVPNQNSFGHMHRWLVHERYRPLAECPQGCVTGWGYTDVPFSLCPLDPGSLELVRGLFDELLPHFTSRQLNVGSDETVDLGRGRCKQEVEEHGAGRVYLDFLQKIYREVKARGYTMQFWGDIIMEYPELTPELPRDTIALEWGYQADHPFDQHGAIFAASGVPYYVCPGTSSWNSIAGRTDNALTNLDNAAANGLKHGAVGYLNTDWGDNGHWQPLSVSYLGFAYGAAVSWAHQANQGLDIGPAISTYAFRDPSGTMGRFAYDLGNTYQEPGVSVHNASILFRILQASPEEIAEKEGLSVDGLRKALEFIDGVMDTASEARLERSDADLIHREFAWVADMLRHACRRGIWALGKAAGGEDAALRQDLADDARRLMEEFREIWHARNRPGGFKDSLARMERVCADYATPHE